MDSPKYITFTGKACIFWIEKIIGRQVIALVGEAVGHRNHIKRRVNALIAKVFAGFRPVFPYAGDVHSPVIDPPAILFAKAGIGENLDKMYVVTGAAAIGQPAFSVTVFFVGFLIGRYV